MRFRVERIAVSAGIEFLFTKMKMFLRDSWHYRVLLERWGDRLGSGRMQSDGAFLRCHFIALFTNFALCRTADGWSPHYSKDVLEAVHRKCYADDLLISLPTVTEATQSVAQFGELLSKGGFNLCKWVCSHEGVYNAVPKAEIAADNWSASCAQADVGNSLRFPWGQFALSVHNIR